MSVRTITAVITDKTGTLAVELDGERWLSLDAVEALYLGLQMGAQVDTALQQRAEQVARGNRALDRGARMISRRSHARAEVEQRIAKQEGPDAARQAADRLTEIGALDDARHARDVIAHRLQTGWGPERCSHDLTIAGVADSVVRIALNEVDIDAIDRAARIALGARSGPEGWRRLSSRGFDRDVAERVLGLPPDDAC